MDENLHISQLFSDDFVEDPCVYLLIQNCKNFLKYLTSLYEYKTLVCKAIVYSIYTLNIIYYIHC